MGLGTEVPHGLLLRNEVMDCILRREFKSLFQWQDRGWGAKTERQSE